MGATSVAVLEYGRAWMLAPSTAERAAELGLAKGFGFWTLGRAGVLGEVEADVAAAAIGFMAPATVAAYWEQRPEGLSAFEIAHEYGLTAAAWGRRAAVSIDERDLDQLADLATKVASAATPSTGMLFAGWRAMPQPEDPAGRVTVALQVLRELRGGAHLSAVHAAGLGPHGAIMSVDDPVRGGADGAERFGWTSPHPVSDTVARSLAEELTSTICAPAYDALDEEEGEDFVRLMSALHAVACS